LALAAPCAIPATDALSDDIRASGWELWSWGGEIEPSRGMYVAPGWTLHQGGYGSRTSCEDGISVYLRKLSGTRTLVPEAANLFMITFTDGQKVRWQFQCVKSQGNVEERP
jgi:hypothetical protein